MDKVVVTWIDDADGYRIERWRPGKINPTVMHLTTAATQKWLGRLREVEGYVKVRGRFAYEGEYVKEQANG